MKNAVVLFLLRQSDKEVLLAQKHKGSEIAGLKWNGYGGKIELGETPVIAMIRETVEETNSSILIKEKDLKYGGIISFYNSDGISDFRVHIFYCSDAFTGQPLSTEVMINPTWFALDRLDQVDMMPADRLFLPIILKDKKVISGEVVFEKGFKGVKKFSYKEISTKEISKLLGEVQE
ncbi:MAG: NUDIX domain-containing protein [bacterium]